MIDVIIVESKDGVKKVAGLQKGILREFIVYDSAKNNEGDVFLGKITKKITTANGKVSYFVNVGKQDVFINAEEHDLEDLNAHEGQDIILQISQEARAEKKARGSRFLQLAGENLVFCPYGDKIDVSNKIEDENKRQGLCELIEQNVDNGGWVIRTHAQEAEKNDVIEEIKALQDRFNEIISKAKASKAPMELWKKDSAVEEMIARNEKYLEKVIVDNHLLEEELAQLCPVEFNRSPFSEYGIEEQLSSALSKEVVLNSGGRVFIEETKALVAIDVDSGERGAQGGLTKLNEDAAKEIARQIILRNLSGKIVIDFAGIGDFHLLKSSLDILSRELKDDFVRSRVLGVTKAGNVEILRHRRRPSLRDIMTIPCESCQGTGRVER